MISLLPKKNIFSLYSFLLPVTLVSLHCHNTQLDQDSSLPKLGTQDKVQTPYRCKTLPPLNVQKYTLNRAHFLTDCYWFLTENCTQLCSTESRMKPSVVILFNMAINKQALQIPRDCTITLFCFFYLWQKLNYVYSVSVLHQRGKVTLSYEVKKPKKNQLKQCKHYLILNKT